MTMGSVLSKFKLFFQTRIKPAWIIILVCLGLGAGMGALITKNHFKKQEQGLFDQIHPVRQNLAQYQFINPLIEYTLPNAKEFPEFQPLAKKINDFIKNKITDGRVGNVSVYFRDLSLGRWVGINENDKYDPASMLKVVIMIAYYKQAETDPAILTKKINYTKTLAGAIDDVPFQTPSGLETGKQYAVEELIQAMIINSDNGAKNALLDNIDDHPLNEVYTDLGMQGPQNNQSYTISAKAYSLFLRSLYNANYINYNYSEKALSLLAGAQYKDGILAGLPPNISVAQKFGEHINTDAAGQPTEIELNNCGIIYYPNHHYVLCVMTRGGNVNDLSDTIKNISQLVYQNVDSDYKK